MSSTTSNCYIFSKKCVIKNYVSLVSLMACHTDHGIFDEFNYDKLLKLGIDNYALNFRSNVIFR